MCNKFIKLFQHPQITVNLKGKDGQTHWVIHREKHDRSQKNNQQKVSWNTKNYLNISRKIDQASQLKTYCIYKWIAPALSIALELHWIVSTSCLIWWVIPVNWAKNIRKKERIEKTNYFQHPNINQKLLFTTLWFLNCFASQSLIIHHI